MAWYTERRAGKARVSHVRPGVGRHETIHITAAIIIIIIIGAKSRPTSSPLALSLYYAKSKADTYVFVPRRAQAEHKEGRGWDRIEMLIGTFMYKLRNTILDDEIFIQFLFQFFFMAYSPRYYLSMKFNVARKTGPYSTFTD